MWLLDNRDSKHNHANFILRFIAYLSHFIERTISRSPNVVKFIPVVCYILQNVVSKIQPDPTVETLDIDR